MPGGEVDGAQGDEGHEYDEEVEEAPRVCEELGERGCEGKWGESVSVFRRIWRRGR